ncbi:unnamed protein product, partial [Rotaria socialis]
MSLSNEMKIEDFIIIWLDENMNEHNEYYRDSIIQLRTIIFLLTLSNNLAEMLVPLINATWWYTKEQFIYAVLNAALRIPDVDIIVNMGFFIKDLHEQIKEIYMQKKETEKLTLYRGQRIRDRDISFLFADSARQKSNTVGILFTIEIDLSISTIPYASLKDISYYSKKQNAEEEILFSMHTIYQIGHIKQIDNNFWEVNLVLTNGNDVQLKLLTAHAREELGGTDEKHALVPLLFKMGELKKAEEIAFALIQSTSELNLNDTMYYSFFYLGQVKYAVGDYSTALSYFEKAISIAEIFFSSYHSTLAVFYNDIGLCYNSTDNHSAALLYYEKALNIQENHPISNHSHLAATYMNTALAYVSMGDYAKALSFYEKAKTMQEEILPPIHPDLATCYNNISKTYSSKGQYKVALSFSEKVRHIREKNLPSNHYSLSSCYDQIALIYEKMGEYSTALLFYEKALNITQKLVPKNYHDIGTQYNNIALQNHKQSHFEVSSSVATVNNNMGLAYNLMEDLSKALLYHNTALDIIEKILPSSHPNV